jgi:hypothetical protein
MFDTVTEQALRLRRLRAPHPAGAEDLSKRTGRICVVCKREVSVDEPLFFVDREAHCAQCHDMLTFELGKERARDAEVKEKGTKWKSRTRAEKNRKPG